MLLFLDRVTLRHGLELGQLNSVLSQSTDVQSMDRHGRVRIRVEPRLVNHVQAVVFDIMEDHSPERAC